METGGFQAYCIVDFVPEETADSSQESSPTEAGPTSSRRSERFGRSGRRMAHLFTVSATAMNKPRRTALQQHAVTFFAQAQAEGVLDLPQ